MTSSRFRLVKDAQFLEEALPLLLTRTLLHYSVEGSIEISLASWLSHKKSTHKSTLSNKETHRRVRDQRWRGAVRHRLSLKRGRPTGRAKSVVG